MGKPPKCWPTHGRAVNARNDAGDASQRIIDICQEAADLIKRDDFTRLELMILISDIQREAHLIRALMIEQGAPLYPR